jgi:hypothetical protein
VWLALVCLPAVGALGWAVCWLASDALSQRRKRNAAIAVARRYLKQRDSMGKHDGNHGQAIAVAELLERAARDGQPLRLNWSEDDTDPYGLVVARDGDDWPTGVLPRTTDDLLDTLEQKLTADSVGELPQRELRHIPAPCRPLWIQRDEELLTRVLGGLRRLGTTPEPGTSPPDQ